MSNPTAMYRSGQVWKYRTRPGEERSRALVVSVETVPPSRRVLYVKLTNLSLRNPHHSGRPLKEVFAPIAEEVFASSVTELADESPDLEGFDEGYDVWRESGRGAFTVPLSEIVTLYETATGH